MRLGAPDAFNKHVYDNMDSFPCSTFGDIVKKLKATNLIAKPLYINPATTTCEQLVFLLEVP